MSIKLSLTAAVITLLCVLSDFTECNKRRMPSKAEILMRIHMRGREGMYDNAADYEYEILNGHPRHDEKTKRQEGCMCYEHYYDPHCGSDMMVYDNGCYFMCVQQRTPGLTLRRWGTCEGNDNGGGGAGGVGFVPSRLVDLDADFDSMDD